MLKPLLITGTERSGTLYTAAVLRAAGLDAGHEDAFNTARHGPVDGIEVSWLAVPYLPLRDAVVVHQVRHPLRAIASSVSRGTFRGERTKRGGHSYGRWAMRRDPVIAQTRDLTGRAARYWVRWNAIAERHAEMQWRIEDLSATDLVEALERAGRSIPVERLEAALARIPSDTNSNGSVSPLSWQDLPDHSRKRIRRAARRYGY